MADHAVSLVISSRRNDVNEEPYKPGNAAIFQEVCVIQSTSKKKAGFPRASDGIHPSKCHFVTLSYAAGGQNRRN